MAQQTVEEVIITDTGENFLARRLFDLSEEDFTLFRRKVMERRKDNPPYLICSMCGKPVFISRFHNIEGNRWFTHFGQSKDCPWHEYGKLSPDKIMALRYRGQQESILHQQLKNFIADWIEKDPCVIGKVNRDKVTLGEYLKGEWKRPDVSCRRKENKIVFEIQLSYTFLSEVIKRDNFYKNERTFIFWIFRELDLRKSTQIDEAFFNHRNIFVLDKEAEQKTKDEGKLYFKCYYQKSVFHELDEVLYWNWTYVTLDEIQYPHATFRPYYIDYNSVLINACMESAIAYYESDYARDKKSDFYLWLSRLENKGFSGAKDYDFAGPHGILTVLLSMMHERAIGWGKKTPFSIFQILESVLRELTQKTDSYKFIFLCAYKIYNPTIEKTKQHDWIENERNKIKQSLRNDEPKYLRDTKYDKIISFLFPELRNALENPKWTKEKQNG